MARWQYEADKNEISDFGVLLTDGEKYLFEVTDVEDKETASGRMMALLSLKVVDGPDNVGAKARGRHNVIQIPQGEPGHGMALQFLKALGWPYDGTLDFDTQEFVGEQFAARVKHETYETDGQERTKNAYQPYLPEGEEAPAEGPTGHPGTSAEAERKAPPKPASKPTPKAKGTKPKKKARRF